MEIGKLRNRIIIKSIENTIDDSGYTNETEKPIESVWAEVIPISSKEFYTNASENVKNIIKFRIRYLKGISSDMKVEFQGKKYNIKGIIDVSCREQIIICELIQSG